MIALLLALAPVAEPYFGNRINAPGLDDTSCSLSVRPPPGQECRLRVGGWAEHCTLAEHGVRACDYDTRQDAYCIWRVDGTVEAKKGRDTK